MTHDKTCPLSAERVLGDYFLDNRHRLLDVAAFLDRVDRCQDPAAARRDPRYGALLRALSVMIGPAEGDRARRVQQCFSDPTDEPLASAAGLKGAHGAWMGGTR